MGDWVRINNYCTLEHTQSSMDWGVIVEFDTYELVCRTRNAEVYHTIQIQKYMDDGTTHISHDISITRTRITETENYAITRDEHIDIAIVNEETSRKVLEHFKKLLQIDK